MADKSQRRVYVLPTELVERITAYQEKLGLNSEVEAVRRLLDIALTSGDDWHAIALRFQERLEETPSLTDAAKDILVGHPLVHRLAMNPGSITFEVTSGETVTITSGGEVTAKDRDGKPLGFYP